MASFPSLRTGAVAQYPLERTIRFRTETVKFLDGSQQRYPLQARALRRWAVRLDLLDECELAVLDNFVEQQAGAVFSFPDPVSGDRVARCIVAGESFDCSVKSEMTGQASLVIQEIA